MSESRTLHFLEIILWDKLETSPFGLWNIYATSLGCHQQTSAHSSILPEGTSRFLKLPRFRCRMPLQCHCYCRMHSWHAPCRITLWFCAEVWFGSAQTQGIYVPSFGWEGGWGSGWSCSHLSALQGGLFLKLSVVTSPKSDAGDLRDL